MLYFLERSAGCLGKKAISLIWILSCTSILIYEKTTGVQGTDEKKLKTVG